MLVIHELKDLPKLGVNWSAAGSLRYQFRRGQAVDAAARAFGGEGFSDLVDIGDRLRDLNGLRIADGATDVMRSAVVRDEFGREFWDMATKGNFDRLSQENEPANSLTTKESNKSQ